MRIFEEPIRFEWDKGNDEKNFLKHKVTNKESEEVFFDENKIVLKSKSKTFKEERYIVIGKSKNNRLLYIVFTDRKNKIRVISARDINKKERRFYEKRADSS